MKSELDKVKLKIDDARFQVAKFIEQHYQDFDPLLIHSRELVETSAKLSEEVQQLADKADTEVVTYLRVCQHNVNPFISSNSSWIVPAMSSHPSVGKSTQPSSKSSCWKEFRDSTRFWKT